MFAKKPPTDTNSPDYHSELEYLYAQRTKLDALIEMLEQYDRFQTTSAPREVRAG